MSGKYWTMIPGKLKAMGFAVRFDRISYDPDHPLWCAKAGRGGRECSSLGDSLAIALLDLEKQALETIEDWRTTLSRMKHPETSVAGTPGSPG
jgi:hypothetical protein